MSSMDEQILRTAKEVVVKFIEVGRISPAAFDESFRAIYRTVEEAVRGPGSEQGEDKGETK